MAVLRPSFPAVLLALITLAAGCASDSGSSSTDAESPTDTLTLDTRADSVAYDLMEAHGADAFASAPYLRFNFAFESPKGSRVIARHLWDRTTGEYRVEWKTGSDSSYVALVDIQNVEEGVPEGDVYLNGEALDGETAQKMREQAYGRFVNDTYWLLAPLKVFDSGVNRQYLADSSTVTHNVLHLTFSDVGRTPGDEYWLYVSKETGQLDRWAYHLEGMNEEDPPQVYEWTDYTTLQAPEGTVVLATRKEAVDADRALLTNELALPPSPPEGAFSNPESMLAADENEDSP